MNSFRDSYYIYLYRSQRQLATNGSKLERDIFWLNMIKRLLKMTVFNHGGDYIETNSLFCIIIKAVTMICFFKKQICWFARRSYSMVFKLSSVGIFMSLWISFFFFSILKDDRGDGNFPSNVSQVCDDICSQIYSNSKLAALMTKGSLM